MALSTDVLTASGESVTLGAGESVGLSVEGDLGETAVFDISGDHDDWTGTITEWTASAEALQSGGEGPGEEAPAPDKSTGDEDGSGSSAFLYIIIVVVVAGLVAGWVLVKRRR